MKRVVVDTNVVVSAYISPKGPLAEIRDAWERQEFELLVSAAILSEYDRVLSYPHVVARHQMSGQEITQVIDNLGRLATMVTVTTELNVVLADPTDDKFVECAIDGGAEMIVSGNKHLLALGSYAGIQVTQPAMFAMLLDLKEG